MNTLFFVELGMGADLHGQDITVAAVRAVQNAITHNSLPGMRSVLPNEDIHEMKVHVKLALPCDHDQLDLEEVKKVLPYGKVSIELLQGGMLTTSGVVLEDKGDQNDQIYIVNASVEVGI